MPISVLSLHLYLPGCSSLKEKRSHIKPILARLQREFNVSAAEMDQQDVWQNAVLACATLSSDAVHNRKLLQQVLNFTTRTWPDVEIVAHSIEEI